MCFEKIVAQLKKELRAPVSKEERERAFQALSGAVITVLLVLYQSYSEIPTQAILCLFTLSTFTIASRFLFKNEKDIQRTELYGAYWSFLTVMFMLFGATLMYLGHEDVWNNALLNSIGANILTSYSVLAMFLLVLFASFAAVMWVREWFTKPKKKDDGKGTQKNNGKKVPAATQPAKKYPVFFSLNKWFVLAILLFVVLWWRLLNFYPVYDIHSSPNLPTRELKLDLGENGDSSISIMCLRGEVFQDRIVQGDMLRCRLLLYNVNKSIFGNRTAISVYSASGDVGEQIPQEDFDMNKAWYTFKPRLEEVSSSNDIVFHIKVPPVHKFAFFVEGLEGYFNYAQPLEVGYPSTQFDEYLQSTLPKIQFFFLLFGVFAAVKYLRDLAENR